MENSWVKIFATQNPVECQIVLSMLRENGVDAYEINKIDSSYTVFGLAEIYCKPEQVIMATQLIQSGNEK
jgi:hypothetical protein